MKKNYVKPEASAVMLSVNENIATSIDGDQWKIVEVNGTYYISTCRDYNLNDSKVSMDLILNKDIVGILLEIRTGNPAFSAYIDANGEYFYDNCRS